MLVSFLKPVSVLVGYAKTVPPIILPIDTTTAPYTFTKYRSSIKLIYLGGIQQLCGQEEEGHYVLKWDFTWTFPGNQDATLK